jgi:hypothetical protein
VSYENLLTSANYYGLDDLEAEVKAKLEEDHVRRTSEKIWREEILKQIQLKRDDDLKMAKGTAMIRQTLNGY